MFHAHYDSRCFLPIHIYEATTGKPVAVILRPGKTPSGAEVALVLRHVVKAIRARWPRVEILIRGDSHYARHEAMTWCERNQGRLRLRPRRRPGPSRPGSPMGPRTRRSPGPLGEAESVRRFGEFRYAAKSWKVERKIIAAAEASAQGTRFRFIVTNLAGAHALAKTAVKCHAGQRRRSLGSMSLSYSSNSGATCDPAQDPGFITAPSGTTPSVTNRHSATKSLRANATTITFRTRRPVVPTRSRNQQTWAEAG